MIKIDENDLIIRAELLSQQGLVLKESVRGGRGGRGGDESYVTPPPDGVQ